MHDQVERLEGDLFDYAHGHRYGLYKMAHMLIGLKRQRRRIKISDRIINQGLLKAEFMRPGPAQDIEYIQVDEFRKLSDGVLHNSWDKKTQMTEEQIRAVVDKADRSLEIVPLMRSLAEENVR
tara:strand:+ start:208 stop:576 length:369 start_codon:yes stop_codon:yes gene_type:complete